MKLIDKLKFKILAVLLLLSISPAAPLFAREIVSGVEFNIRLFDRRIFFVGTEPIHVQMTIVNNSPQVFRFRLADDRAFSVDFDTRTMTNRQLPQSDALIRARTQNQQIFFREIAIETGESFSFIEDLRNYISFENPGSFRVRAMIYPELFRGSASPVIKSNFLPLTIRPDVILGYCGIPLEMDVETGAILLRQALPPDEVVSFTIRARQTSQWERFFLYLDLEAMILRDPVLRRRWQAENEPGRRRMLAEYRTNMQSAVVEGGISQIPTTFTIERTTFTSDEATVSVHKRFRHINFTELRRYTYFLERRDNIWMITGYSIMGLGTEAN